ncbi:uracil-DNA glycosylase [Allofustis seminis]|uniref:uracil-DNA glycosylase n=1 Tax=Allofustis seminis TaxID=166939 RepID=UPI00037C081B|nr:uracil-DNA glycosylase [Allofustis seminis]
MNLPIHNDWRPILEEAMTQPSYRSLREFLKQEYRTQTIYPQMYDLWTAFEWTPYQRVKVVILGQDPYHGPHQAHGLSFSVQPGVPLPPSLQNIYKELEADVGARPVAHGYLKHWADQGVFLLNTVLTVRAHQAHSHRGKGWEELTDFVIEKLNERETPMVFILWGSAAKAKRAKIDESKHAIITSVHPSPLSAYRGFFGSRPFSKANAYLKQWHQQPIDWQLPIVINESRSFPS